MAVQQHVLNWLYSVLTSEYQDVNRTYNDVSQALSYFLSLSPRTDVHTFPNGASALLLHLSGTIPAVFRGATYRYPISLWVPHNYPREAPLVYVTPTENMMVRPGQHVDPQGQVYHPYLAGWAEFWDKSTICDFLTILRDVFAKEPPVIARQTPRPTPAQAPIASPTPPPAPLPPQELASPSYPPSQQQQQQQNQQQPPPPPPKGNGTPQHSVAAAAHHTPSPPPVPPHPTYGNNSTNNAYPSQAAPSPPPPPPPHPSSSAAPSGVRSSWYGASPPPPQAVEAGPSAARSSTSGGGGPPVPGRPERPDRPAYQQSPLGQPPMSPSQQHQQPPYASAASYGRPQPPQPPQPSSTSTSSPPPQTGPYGQPPQNAYYQYQQQQQQPQQSQQGYPQQQQSQQAPPPWQQQQYQQYNSQQQQQQYPPQQQQPFQQQQVQPRPRQPPPPDLMDEPANGDSNNNDGRDGSGVNNGQSGPNAHNQTGGPAQPPPVPPNPEKDALLHQLAQTLAAQRQQIRDKNDLSLAGLRAQRAAMLTAAQRLQQDMSDVAQLSALLTSNTDILHESLAQADGLIANSQQTPAPAIDDLLVGPTVVANQLYDLVAEERALADAVFMLGRAVERGRIAPAVFAKMTRSLAREWYLKKALVRKVGRGMGLSSA